MKICILFGLGILFSAAAFAQPAAKDSLSLWRRQRARISRKVDSLRILADLCNYNMLSLEDQKKQANAELTTEAERRSAHHNANQERMDSLNTKIILLSQIHKMVEHHFDDILVALDGILGIRNELDAKIKANTPPPR